MLDRKPKLLSKTSLRRLNGKKVRLSASRGAGLIPTQKPAKRSGGASGAAGAAERVLNQIANDDEDTIEKEEQDQREQP